MSSEMYVEWECRGSWRMAEKTFLRRLAISKALAAIAEYNALM